MGIKEFIYRKGTVGQTARHIGKVYLKLKPNTTVKTLNDNSFDKESLYSIILLQRAMSFINLSPTIYNNYINSLIEKVLWGSLEHLVIFIIETEANTNLMIDFGSKTYFLVSKIVYEELLKVGVPEADLA